MWSTTTPPRAGRRSLAVPARVGQPRVLLDRSRHLPRHRHRRHPGPPLRHVMDLILSSLRYWVQEMHVDGFRFDLAATLGRDENGFSHDHPLLRAILTDPLRVKLIAEPWDVGTGGWQTGNFPPPFTEWNDAFRDDVRSFWLPTGRCASAPASAPRAGCATSRRGWPAPRTCSPGRIRPSSRPGAACASWASVNYVTAHDGFTLRDLTVYETKRNHANGEDNRDGTSNNRSYHHGHEGELPEGRPEAERIEQARRRTARSILATLLLASGTRCSPPATSAAAPSRATTTPTARTTRSPGSTGGAPAAGSSCARRSRACCSCAGAPPAAQPALPAPRRSGAPRRRAGRLVHGRRARDGARGLDGSRPAPVVHAAPRDPGP